MCLLKRSQARGRNRVWGVTCQAGLIQGAAQHEIVEGAQPAWYVRIHRRRSRLLHTYLNTSLQVAGKGRLQRFLSAC